MGDQCPCCEPPWRFKRISQAVSCPFFCAGGAPAFLEIVVAGVTDGNCAECSSHWNAIHYCSFSGQTPIVSTALQLGFPYAADAPPAVNTTACIFAQTLGSPIDTNDHCGIGRDSTGNKRYRAWAIFYDFKDGTWAVYVAFNNSAGGVAQGIYTQPLASYWNFFDPSYFECFDAMVLTRHTHPQIECVNFPPTITIAPSVGPP